MRFDYQKICAGLTSDLKEKEKEVISRRFGLNGLERETLESIGQGFGISRERVRQIQKAGILKIKPKLSKYQKVFQYFREYFKKYGNLRKEDLLLSELGGGKFQGEEDKFSSSNEVYFLLSIKEPFKKFNGNKEIYPFWMVDLNSFELAKKLIDSLIEKFQKIGKPLTLKELSSFSSRAIAKGEEENLFSSPSLKSSVLTSYLTISKKIQKNREGLYGLKDWPEINPRGIKDKAYLVFKKIGKPLHFQEVTNLIKNAHLQTVHNELIKNSRFVLVGRGIYALSEWGYTAGEVKEVIFKILKESEKPLKKEEILEKVLSQRLVKENTILLNLSNKKYFLRDSEGKYKIKEI